MEPRIQYAKTSDGVSIAYWTQGKGMPFVHMPWFRASHVQLEWQIPEYRQWYEGLARNRQLVRYDARGIGMSDRDVSDYSLAALVSDLEAVVDRLELKTFALFGLLHGGPVAIAYAARHPERVSHLVLWCTYARNADYEQSSKIKAVRTLREQDWVLYTETMAHVRLGWSEGPSAREFARLIRESMTPESLQAIQEVYRDLDVSDLLGGISAPTLILHREELAWLPLEIARGLAAAIRDASLTIVPGTSGAPFLEDTGAVLTAIDRFLGLKARPRRGAPARKTSRGKEPKVKTGRKGSAVQTILFSDIEGSTALTERLGDAKARDVIRRHERIIRLALKAHGGSEVKATGDGFMASFGSATKAVECAVAIQQEIGNQQSEIGERIQVRIGLNAGEPIAERDPDGRGDLFGTAVIVAARIAAQAAGGEILVSDVVRQLVAGKGFVFADRGETALRGFEEPVRVYEVSWRGGE